MWRQGSSKVAPAAAGPVLPPAASHEVADSQSVPQVDDPGIVSSPFMRRRGRRRRGRSAGGRHRKPPPVAVNAWVEQTQQLGTAEQSEAASRHHKRSKSHESRSSAKRGGKIIMHKAITDVDLVEHMQRRKEVFGRPVQTEATKIVTVNADKCKLNGHEKTAQNVGDCKVQDNDSSYESDEEQSVDVISVDYEGQNEVPDGADGHLCRSCQATGLYVRVKSAPKAALDKRKDFISLNKSSVSSGNNITKQKSSSYFTHASANFMNDAEAKMPKTSRATSAPVARMKADKSNKPTRASQQQVKPEEDIEGTDYQRAILESHLREIIQSEMLKDEAKSRKVQVSYFGDYHNHVDNNIFHANIYQQRYFRQQQQQQKQHQQQHQSKNCHLGAAARAHTLSNGGKRLSATPLHAHQRAHSLQSAIQLNTAAPPTTQQHPASGKPAAASTSGSASALLGTSQYMQKRQYANPCVLAQTQVPTEREKAVNPTFSLQPQPLPPEDQIKPMLGYDPATLKASRGGGRRAVKPILKGSETFNRYGSAKSVSFNLP